MITPNALGLFQANVGSLDTRNKGLELVKGVYVALVEADDYVESGKEALIGHE